MKKISIQCFPSNQVLSPQNFGAWNTCELTPSMGMILNIEQGYWLFLSQRISAIVWRCAVHTYKNLDFQQNHGWAKALVIKWMEICITFFKCKTRVNWRYNTHQSQHHVWALLSFATELKWSTYSISAIYQVGPTLKCVSAI